MVNSDIQKESADIISDLKEKLDKLQRENDKLVFDKRKLILESKQRKLDLTALKISFEKYKMESTKKIWALNDEIVNIRNERPTLDKIMNRAVEHLNKARTDK